MVYACGIDLEEIDRFNKHYFENGRLPDLIYDLFTSKEIENFSILGKEAFLKGFSFKEAFYKAMNNPDIGFHDVEIIFNLDDTFKISFSNHLKNILNHLNIIDIKADYKITDQFITFKVILIN